MYNNHSDQLHGIGRPITLIAGVGLVTLVVGWLLTDGSGGGTGHRDLWPWLLLSGVVGLLLIIVRPILAVLGVLAFIFVNPSLLPNLLDIGEFSIRYVDIAVSMLTLAVVFRFLSGRVIPLETLRQLFGPMLPLICYAGLSLALVWLYTANSFSASIASYTRLLVTAGFGLLLYTSISNLQDLELFHKGLIGFGVATVGIGMWEAEPGHVLDILEINGWGTEATARYGGFLGVNALGLVAGLLILSASLRRDKTSNSISRGVVLMTGLLGLILAKSASSILATAGVVTLYRITTRAQRFGFLRLFKWAMIGMVVVAGATVIIQALRPSDVGGLLELSGGSFAQRLMIAYGGMLIFLEHPLVGVGWQASATPEFIGSPSLNAVLMETFSALPGHYFFLETTTSLHNLYVQVLVELGLLGGGLFAYACVRIGRRVAGVVRGLPEDSPYRSRAEFYAFGLVFLLIWWNTTPLFSGQTDSMLAFAFLGALAAIGRLEKQRRRCECPPGREMVTQNESATPR